MEENSIEPPLSNSLRQSISSCESIEDEILQDTQKGPTIAEPEKRQAPVTSNNTKNPHKVIFNVAEAEYDVIKQVGSDIFKWELSYDLNEDWDIYWTDNSVPIEALARMRHYQKVNHFPGMHSIARKNNLGRNLRKMKKVFPEFYKFFPKTFLLPGDYQEFKNQFLKAKKSKTFIVKPEAESQGKGIFLTKTGDNIGPQDHLIAQKYLENPYLINGLKFDLRIYVLVTGCDPLRIYLYNDGLGRFATEPYNIPSHENLSNTCMHLTNYAINKENPNFIFNNSSNDDSIGHKKSLKAVFKILEEQGHNVGALWEEIKKIIRKVLCSVQPILSNNYKSCQPNDFYNNMCFEILGFDVMLDDKLKPWLIEVNHLPSFAADTPLDLNIKKNVIKDAFNLLNVSAKNKINYKNKKRLELQQKKLNGKTIKMTPQERLDAIKVAQKERDDWESRNSGGYEKIFPLDENEKVDEDYQEFIKIAHQYWEVWTGTGARKNIAKSPIRQEDQSHSDAVEDSNSRKLIAVSPNKPKQFLLSPRNSTNLINRKTFNFISNNITGGFEAKGTSGDTPKGISTFHKPGEVRTRTQRVTFNSWKKQEISKPNLRDSETQKEKFDAENEEPAVLPPKGQTDMTKSDLMLPKIVEKVDDRLLTDPSLKENSTHLSSSVIMNPSETPFSELGTKNVLLAAGNSQTLANFQMTLSKIEPRSNLIKYYFITSKGRKNYKKVNNFRKTSYAMDSEANQYELEYRLSPQRESNFKPKNSIGGDSEQIAQKNAQYIPKPTLLTLDVNFNQQIHKMPFIYTNTSAQATAKINLQMNSIKNTFATQTCRLNYPGGFMPFKIYENNFPIKKEIKNESFDQRRLLLNGKSIPKHNNGSITNNLIRGMTKNG